MANPYTETNVDGFISLAYAENKLVWPFIAEWYRGTALTQAESLYDYTFGGSSLRRGFVRYLSRFTSKELSHNNIVAGDGALAVMENLAFALFERGDSIGLLMPCYAQHRNILTHRAGNVIVAAESLEAMMLLIREHKVRGVIFTNPSNPAGFVYSRQQVKELVDACAGHKVHLISDEIYASCVFDGTMVSVLDFVTTEAHEPYIHLISGLAKIGWSGAKLGLLYSSSRPLITTMRALSRLAPVATPGAAAATRMLAAGSHVLESLLKSNARLLRNQYASVTQMLDSLRIPFIPAMGGLTICLDFRALVKDFAGELALYNIFVSEGRFQLAQGKDFGFRVPGFFRVTLAEPLDVVQEALRRIHSMLQKLNMSHLAARESMMSRMRQVWDRTDQIFGLLCSGQEAVLQRPIHLRHPFIFYIGHLSAFLWNQLQQVAPELPLIDQELQDLFDRGIDPDVDDPSKVHSNSAGTEERTDWPTLERVHAFRDQVRAQLPGALDIILAKDPASRFELEQGRILELVFEHEAMHQETLLYMFNCLDEKWFREGAAASIRPPAALGNELEELTMAFAHIPASKRVPLGADRQAAWGWDNEFPQLEAEVDAFSIRQTPITNGEFLDFVQAGAYSRQELWDEVDWAWLQKESITHPVHWKKNGENWTIRTLAERVPLAGAALQWPVQVSHAEAKAYCQFLGDGSRLPTETEWYHAAYSESTEEGFRYRKYPWGNQPPTKGHGNFGFANWQPTPVHAYPDSRSYWGLMDLMGNGWEWTSTPFAGFPGFEPFLKTYPGYSKDFFDGKHFVLRGGSFASVVEELRPSFRNWYQTRYPYTFSKFRVVRPVAQASLSASGTIVRLEAAASVEDTLDGFAKHVEEGLSLALPQLSSMYLYDDEGSAIYEEITTLEEYYPFKSEISILHQAKSALAEILIADAGRCFNVVELGCGSGEKTQILLSHLQSLSLDVSFYPIDISEGALKSLMGRVKFPKVFPIVANNLTGLSYVVSQTRSPSLVLFLGSSIGNFDHDESISFLRKMQEQLRVGDYAFVGFDLKKDLKRLHAAYFDSKGVTSRFNSNLLKRMNRELGSNFKLDEWQHEAIFNGNVGAMESWIMPKEDCTVAFGPRLKNKQWHFRAWEGIRVERSHKYTVDSIHEICKEAGMTVVRLFQFRGYSNVLMRKSKGSE